MANISKVKVGDTEYGLNADDSDKLDGYNRSNLFEDYADFLGVIGLTQKIVVDGDKDTYYPVVIIASHDKRAPTKISIWKNLGSKTASYPKNHPNGTSSMWLIYEGRRTSWDENGGFYRLLYRNMPYAELCAHTSVAGNGVGGLVVYLRGGGCEYNIATSNKADVNVYLTPTNIGGTSPVNVAPMTKIGNSGINFETFRLYGKATSAGTADSVAWANVNNKPAQATRWPSWGEVTNKPTSMPASDVSAWAKAATKPSYTWGEITNKPTTFTPAAHSHDYLPLSGGTVTGEINLTANHAITANPGDNYQLTPGRPWYGFGTYNYAHPIDGNVIATHIGGFYGVDIVSNTYIKLSGADVMVDKGLRLNDNAMLLFYRENINWANISMNTAGEILCSTANGTGANATVKAGNFVGNLSWNYITDRPHLVTAGVNDGNDMSAMGNTSFIKSTYATANAPVNNQWYNMIQLAHRNGEGDGASFVSQIAIGMTANTESMWFRGSRNNGWVSVITDKNIGSQSVSHAETADTANTVADGLIGWNKLSPAVQEMLNNSGAGYAVYQDYAVINGTGITYYRKITTTNYELRSISRGTNQLASDTLKLSNKVYTISGEAPTSGLGDPEIKQLIIQANTTSDAIYWVHLSPGQEIDVLVLNNKTRIYIRTANKGDFAIAANPSGATAFKLFAPLTNSFNTAYSPYAIGL